MVRRTRPGISRFRVRALRAPERRVEIFPSQPPLPSLEAFQILETLALVAGAAEVEFLDVLIVAQLVGAAVEHHLALLHDVAVARARKRGARVLFHQEDGDTEVSADLLLDREHFLDQQRRQY